MIRRTRVREKIKNALRGLLKEKEDRLFLTSALAGDGQGNIEVPGDPRKIYVRASGQVLVVFNNRLTVREDTPIWIGLKKNQTQLIQVLSLNYGSTVPGSWVPPEIAEHGWTHQLYAEHGGNDIVWIEQRQFLPLSAALTGDYELTIYPGVLLTENGWKVIASQEVDLTSSIPEDVSKYRFALVYIDPDGIVQIEDGALVSTNPTMADIPIPDEGCYGIYAVRLWSSQGSLTDSRESSDLVDLRFPQSLPGAHTHEAPQVDMDLDDLGDVEAPSPDDQDIIRYELASTTWKSTSLAEIGAESPDSQTHIHAALETYGDGVQRVFILPNNYEPLTTEVFINGLRLRFEIEWNEFSEDSIKLVEAPHQDDLLTVNHVPEVKSVVI